jgi:hypothetical protein
MNFNKHSDLVGDHAFLSPSKYHWTNYSEAKLVDTYKKFLAVQKGTELHAFACNCIRLGIKLPKSKKSLNNYINDGIGYRLIPEQPLFYSVNAFGTADTIGFRDNFLRIHDLKTGSSPVSIRQLEVYVGLFCLEYGVHPEDIAIELRIYQLDEILVHIPSSEDILTIMQKIVLFDKAIENIKTEENHA